MLFAATILLGAGLLMLPAASTEEPLRVVDALFTATSAVCVTGLTVVDTGTRLTLFGQLVVLTLIQLGGLGMMTFATVLVLSLGSGLSLRNRVGLHDSLTGSQNIDERQLLKAVFATTVAIEAVGALALFPFFWSRMPAGDAAYTAVFHAISAFCNAGFSTFSNSLEGYQNSTGVLLIMATIIILGGLGFVVIHELLLAAKQRPMRLSLHTKLCVSFTVILLVAGTVGFYVAEHEHLLKSHGMGLNLVNAFFQSVTCRTAGFNAVPQADLTELSILITMLLMFVGACPGSTGGGIKVTTFAIIVLLVLRRFSGYQTVSMFRRAVSQNCYTRALSVFVLSVGTVVVLFSMFMFVEEKAVSHSLSHGWFVDNLFEVISAFGTVGLSLGITAKLHAVGKLLLVALMYVGRVGMLTLAFSLARQSRPGEIVYAEEDVMVG